MGGKKIKIFLGGYVNFQNAQNLNCKALSEHLDKERFEISTMLYPFSFRSDFQPYPSVRYIKLRRPVSLFRYLAFLKGIANSDVAFLPKGKNTRFCVFIAKISNTKVFNTLEGILDEVLEQRIGKQNFKAYINRYTLFEPNLFAITKYIANIESKRHNLKFDDELLYLGVDSNKFLSNTFRDYDNLKNIIFIGNDPFRKNIKDFFEVSSVFPNIKFHIVGGHQLQNGTIEEYIHQHNIQNITYHGPLNHSELSSLLSEMDLMYFPSRSEGFPKVHLETACAGVPSLCYGDYGASEWITSWKNGIIVETKEEAINAIKKLKENPEKLKELSINAVELGKSFDWKIVVKKWEEVIERIYYSKQRGE